METNIIKTIELNNANAAELEKIVKEVKDEGIHVYQVGGKYLFPIDNSEESELFVEEIEDHAFGLGLDYTKGALVYFEESSNRTAASSVLLNEYAEEEQISEVEDGVSIANIPDFIEFIANNEEKAVEEMNDLLPEIVENVEEVEDLEEFSDDIDAIFDEVLKDIGENSSEALNDELEDAEIEEADEPDTGTNPSEGKSLDPIHLRSEIASDSYLLEKAKTMFDSQAPLNLPKYDEVTNKEIQHQFIVAQSEIEKAREKGIAEIYKRLKAETDESMQTIETHLLREARENHNRTLNVINSNFKVDAENVVSDSDKQYEKERTNFIHAQIPALEKQYDALNQRNHQAVVDSKLNKLNNKKIEQINEENLKYQEYLNKIFDEGKEKMLNSVNVDDVIEEYNEIAEEQLNALKTFAGQLQGQIGETITKLLKERKTFKQEIKAIENEKHDLEVQLREQQGMTERESSEKIQELLKEKEHAENQAQLELENALKKSRDLEAEVQVLERTLESKQTADDEDVEMKYATPVINLRTSSEPTEQPIVQPASIPTAKTSYWKKAIVPYILGTLAIGALLGGVYSLNGIKNEMHESTELQKTVYLSQLETNKEYDKLANTMDQYGYKPKDIARMYLDHDDYESAVREDNKLLSEVFSLIAEDPVHEKENLKKLQQIDALTQNQLKSIETKIAILEDNLEAVKAQSVELVSDDGTIDQAVEYLIQKKAFPEAEALLTNHSNKDLQKKVETAKQDEEKAQVENAEKSVTDLENQVAEVNRQNEELNKQMAEAKKAEGKEKEVKTKEAELSENVERKEELNQKLAEAKKVLESLK
ncbi:TPA: hypothetical protein ACWWCX_002366 [Enterococcus faecium]